MQQPILDDVPDTVLRQVPKGNVYLKELAYDSLKRWLMNKLADDPGAITATSPDDDANMPRLNLLSTLAMFRPNYGGGNALIHKEVACMIIKLFYEAGLINMRLSRNRTTAFIMACAAGNIEIAELLLEYGAGIPLWLITLWAPYPELVSPPGGHAFLGGGCVGEAVGFELGARKNGSCHDHSASRASAGCLL